MAELEKQYDKQSATYLGHGDGGSVFAVQRKETKQLFGMKLVAAQPPQLSMEELKQEVEQQGTLDHPCICRMYETYENEEAGEVTIVQELCTGGSLVSRLKAEAWYGERSVATIVEKVLS